MKTTKRMRTPLFALLLLAVVFAGCEKETENFDSEPLSAYLPVQTGKFIVYHTDSTVFTNFGTMTVTRSYQEKHEIEAAITDNKGRPAYRVFRSLRNADGSGAWRPAGSYFIVAERNHVEVVENNLRFLKLALPIRPDYTWKGNRFLPNDPYGNSYAFSNDDNMADWDYTYTQSGETLVMNGKTIPDVLTVQHVDEKVNAPVTQPGAYGYINFSTNKFGKGIGLVYEETVMWEYQPNPGGSSGYRTGFGVKRTLLDHN